MNWNAVWFGDGIYKRLVIVGWLISKEVIELMDSPKFGCVGGDSNTTEGSWGGGESDYHDH